MAALILPIALVGLLAPLAPQAALPLLATRAPLQMTLLGFPADLSSHSTSELHSLTTTSIVADAGFSETLEAVIGLALPLSFAAFIFFAFSKLWKLFSSQF